MLSRASNTRSSHSQNHNEYLQKRHETCKVGTKVMVNWRNGQHWEKLPGTITSRPSGITSKYKVKFEGEGDIWKVKMLSIYERQETCGIVSIGWDDVDDDDEEEAIDPEEEDEEEEEEDAIDEEDDQGDKIGEFWSEINYKEGKYTVRVVGHVADDNYWVQQWQPKKLEFKGGRWQKKAIYIKVKK
jgi:hypothetical protein